MYDTPFTNNYDLLDTIIINIEAYKKGDHKEYVDAMLNLFCLCQKYNMSEAVLNYIHNLNNNLIKDICNLAEDIYNQEKDINLKLFLDTPNELYHLKKMLIDTINDTQQKVNTVYSIVTSISAVSACFGLATLGFLLLSPLQCFFMVGSALIALGLITFAIMNIVQYFKSIEYKQDINNAELLDYAQNSNDAMDFHL